MTLTPLKYFEGKLVLDAIDESDEMDIHSELTNRRLAYLDRLTKKVESDSAIIWLVETSKNITRALPSYCNDLSSVEHKKLFCTSTSFSPETVKTVGLRPLTEAVEFDLRVALEELSIDDSKYILLPIFRSDSSLTNPKKVTISDLLAFVAINSIKEFDVDEAISYELELLALNLEAGRTNRIVNAVSSYPSGQPAFCVFQTHGINSSSRVIL